MGITTNKNIKNSILIQNTKYNKKHRIQHIKNAGISNKFT